MEQLTDIQKLQAEVEATQKKLAEAQQLKELTEKKIKQAEILAKVQGELAEAERKLKDVSGKSFKANAEQFDIAKINYERRSELEDMIRKHALSQLEGQNLDFYKKVSLDNYVKLLAEHIDGAKRNPERLIGKEYPFPNEYEAAGISDVVLNIKPFVPIRQQGG